MMDQERVKKLIADNIAFYRKRSGLTQAELAEKINYSDKAVSKWERGDGVPDVMVLMNMADIFGISLNDFTAEPLRRKFNVIKRNKLIISLLSVGIVWLVATLAFVIMSLAKPDFCYKYMAFIYALPCSAILMTVFSAVWKYKYVLLVSVSMIIWTTILSVYLTVWYVPNASYLFIIGIPLQVLTVFWSLKKSKKSEKSEQ